MNFKLLYTFIFLAICTYNQSKPMNWLANFNNSDSPIVTEPYQPSFSARYPKMSNLLKSSALGGFAALCAHRQSTDNPSLVIGAATFATVFAYNAFKKPSILDSLLTNPSKFLHQLDNFTKKLKQKKINNKSADLQKQVSIYKDLKKETKKDSPLFLLDECTTSPAHLFGYCVEKGCALRREYQPDYRKIYEDRVVTALSSKSKTLQQPIQYTSFGCGGMLQDLVIITKFLAQNPCAKINVHLIDVNHNLYHEIRNLLGKNLQPEPKEKSNIIESKMNEIITLARTKWGAGFENSDEEIKKNVAMSYMQTNDRGKQFISYLRKTFPNAQTCLYLHPATKDYFTYLQTHCIPYPDVVVAADITDDMSLMKHSTGNYVSLCNKTLQNKPESINIWLEKNSIATTTMPNSLKEEIIFMLTEAEIISVSPDQTINTEKKEFGLDDENKVTAYLKKDDITKGWLGSAIKRLFGIFGYFGSNK